MPVILLSRGLLLQACGTDWKEIVLDRWSPCLVEVSAGEIRLGHPLVDDFLELVRARARRNTLLAAAYDSKVFFTVVGKGPLEVKTADVYSFVQAQRQGAASVEDGAVDGWFGGVGVVHDPAPVVDGVGLLRVSRRDRMPGSLTGRSLRGHAPSWDRRRRPTGYLSWNLAEIELPSCVVTVTK